MKIKANLPSHPLTSLFSIVTPGLFENQSQEKSIIFFAHIPFMNPFYDYKLPFHLLGSRQHPIYGLVSKWGGGAIIPPSPFIFIFTPPTFIIDNLPYSPFYYQNPFPLPFSILILFTIPFSFIYLPIISSPTHLSKM